MVFGNSLCKPLELKFNDCLGNGILPFDWKRGHTVLFHEKNDSMIRGTRASINFYQ